MPKPAHSASPVTSNARRSERRKPQCGKLVSLNAVGGEEFMSGTQLELERRAAVQAVVDGSAGGRPRPGRQRSQANQTPPTNTFDNSATAYSTNA